MKRNIIFNIKMLDKTNQKCLASFYLRICPLPKIKYFVEVKAGKPIGPRACNFCVLIPISAPYPNSKPSVKRVDAL